MELDAKTRKVYDELNAHCVAEYDAGETSVTNILAKQLRLQQVTSGYVPKDDGDIERLGNEKIEAMMDTATPILDAGGKVVVFARFTDEVQRSVSALSKDYTVAEISGRVSDAERLSGRTAFQEDEDPRAMVCQIQAGGVGIPLHAAHTEIFVSKTFSFGDYDQARARITEFDHDGHKLTYYHLVVTGTVDDVIEESRKTKRDLAAIVQDRGRGIFG